MYKLNWEVFHTNNFNDILNEYNKDLPALIAFDTETDGLNIMKSKPFLLIVAWKLKEENKGKCYVIDWEPFGANQLFQACKSSRFIVGANLKYDLHMFRNGGAEFPFEILNENCELTDIQILKRLLLETDASENENKLALKQMAKSLIDPNANSSESKIKELKMSLDTTNKKVLNEMLKPYKLNWNKLKNILEDPTQGLISLPLEVQEVYNTWNENFGNATYAKLYQLHRDEMMKYAAYDGIFTIEVFLNLWETYQKVNNTNNQCLDYVFHQENTLIEEYYLQEKVGMKVDLNYLIQSRTKLISHIGSMRKELELLCGCEVTEGQHKVLLEIFQHKYKVPKEAFISKYKETTIDVHDSNGNYLGKKTIQEPKYSCDKSTLLKLTNYGEKVERLAKLIVQLRNFTKYLSTYIDGIYQKVVENGDGKFHAISKSTGTVSGRISGDLQQHPKYPILDSEGNELFHPRKAFIPSGGDYNYWVLQDFDQMELRVQAHYTIQFGCTDVNLCRIFVPLNCKHKIFNEVFDFNNKKHLEHWNDKDENGNSLWLDNYTNEPWVAVDPHGMHVKAAFGIDDTHENWKRLRTAAKTINFARIYGSGLKGILENDILIDFKKEILESIYNSFTENFPGIIQYNQIVNNQIRRTGKMSNIYGRIYKFTNPKSSYKCANYLIQGSCADFVKACLINVRKFFKAYNLKSRMLYTIHDEIIWEVHKDEGWAIKYVEQILNKTAQWCKIPLTCGTDITYTNWAEKKDIKEILKC